MQAAIPITSTSSNAKTQTSSLMDKVNTSESVGLRTYLKTKLKGPFSVQGEAEWNYMTRFFSIEELKNYNAWQTSALSLLYGL